MYPFFTSVQNNLRMISIDLICVYNNVLFRIHKREIYKNGKIDLTTRGFMIS